MTDETEPTIPASAPPGFDDLRPKEYRNRNCPRHPWQTMQNKQGYRWCSAPGCDWHAALAAQPPEPQECNLIGGNDGLWCTVHGAEAPNGICESAPPQPGDAETIAHGLMLDAHEACGVYHTGIKGRVRRLLDAAQFALAESRAALANSVDRSAYDECNRQLAESRAEVARLARERDDYKADSLRLHKDKCDLLDEKLSATGRLRSPTDTGEEYPEPQEDKP